MNSITYPYLSDLRFLKELDKLNIKEQFVKIIVLDWLENPIANIEGRVSGGSMNLDGSSAVRRSGSITFICDDEYYNVLDVNNLISINKKIKIEIGYTNTTDKYTEYDKIWFPQGVFVIINPSITHNNQGLSIAISFKDKMCLLNGECGGVLPASVTFHEREEEDGTITRVTYYQIIRELVSEFGGEQLGKIIINDVPTRIKKVMKWVGDEPITLKGSGQKRTDWLFIDGYSKGSDIEIEDNALLWSKLAVKTIDEEGSTITITCTPTEPEQEYKLKIVYKDSQGNINTADIKENEWKDKILTGPQEQTFSITKGFDGKQFGVQLYNAFSQYYTLSITTENPEGSTLQIDAQPQEDIGYIYTDFCPTSDLIGNAGQNVVTILDNIKKQLGNYEYFYDIDGNFIFQEIRNYLNTSQSTNEYNTLISQGYLTPALTKSVYQFTDSRLITAYQNTPQYANIKNDFIVWGIRESAAGAKMPIRYHVAFDTKPQVGNTYYCFTQVDSEGQEYISKVFSPKSGLNKTIATRTLPTKGRGDAWYIIQSETQTTTEGDKDDETTIPTSDFYLFNCTLIAKSQAVQMSGDLYEFNFDHNITLQKGQKYIIELSMLNQDRFKESLDLPNGTTPEEQYHISGRFNDKIPFGDDFYLNTDAYAWYFIYSPDEQGEKTFRMFSFDKRPKDTNYEPHQSRDYDLDLTTEDFVSIYSYVDNDTEQNQWELFEQDVPNKEFQPKTVITQNYQTELYIQGVAMPGSNRYYSELVAEWPKMFQLKKYTDIDETVTWRDEPTYSTIDLEKQIPANPDYYLDIIEPTSKVGEFSIPSIGVRSKVWSDNAVNCIFETDPPDVILIEAGTPHTEADRNEAMSNSDSYYQVPSSIYNALAGGGYQNSAFNAIRDVLYQYTNYNESITLTALPIYYLEPNTRITVEDEKSSIHGDYMIKSISRPFDCNGTMQITATKALERF